VIASVAARRDAIDEVIEKGLIRTRMQSITRGAVVPSATASNPGAAYPLNDLHGAELLGGLRRGEGRQRESSSAIDPTGASMTGIRRGTPRSVVGNRRR